MIFFVMRMGGKRIENVGQLGDGGRAGRNSV